MNNNLGNFIQKYINKGKMLQIATVSGDQPWSCTVYYASDENLNLYWISKPSTRHSQEIHKHSKVAASIPIKFDDLIVVGVQLEGIAELIEDQNEIKEKVKLYSDKFNRGDKWYQEFVAGKNPHKLYRIRPKLFVLFDRVNFPDNDRQEWKP